MREPGTEVPRVWILKNRNLQDTDLQAALEDLAWQR